MKNKGLLIIATIIALTGCTLRPRTSYIPAPAAYGNEQKKISLLNPMTRNIIHCYSTNSFPAEECARIYENKNYIRFRNIPYKTANYDFLTRDTYPTRRWRMGERTPRW